MENQIISQNKLTDKITTNEFTTNDITDKKNEYNKMFRFILKEMKDCICTSEISKIIKIIKSIDNVKMLLDHLVCSDLFRLCCIMDWKNLAIEKNIISKSHENYSFFNNIPDDDKDNLVNFINDKINESKNDYYFIIEHNSNMGSLKMIDDCPEINIKLIACTPNYDYEDSDNCIFYASLYIKYIHSDLDEIEIEHYSYDNTLNTDNFNLLLKLFEKNGKLLIERTFEDTFLNNNITYIYKKFYRIIQKSINILNNLDEYNSDENDY